MGGPSLNTHTALQVTTDPGAASKYPKIYCPTISATGTIFSVFVHLACQLFGVQIEVPLTERNFPLLSTPPPQVLALDGHTLVRPSPPFLRPPSWVRCIRPTETTTFPRTQLHDVYSLGRGIKVSRRCAPSPFVLTRNVSDSPKEEQLSTVMCA